VIELQKVEHARATALLLKQAPESGTGPALHLMLADDHETTLALTVHKGEEVKISSQTVQPEATQ
jgi:hypothetical protein